MSRLGAVILLLGVAQSAYPQALTDVFTGSTRAVEYQADAGKTKVDFKGTPFMPQAKGEAKIQAKPGDTAIEAKVQRLSQVRVFGGGFLIYVLWAVSPDGKAKNLGMIKVNDKGDGKLKASTEMETFSLLVTAEPYFAVSMPSEVIVLENEIRKDTKGKQLVIDQYQLVKRGRYQKRVSSSAAPLDLKSQPLELYEARNAVAIARANGAGRYASEMFVKAAFDLQVAENTLKLQADHEQLVSTAHEAVQLSQDALMLGIERREQERLEIERKAREAAERRARELAEYEAARRAQAEADKRRAQEQGVRVEPQLAPAKVEAGQTTADASARDADAQRLQALLAAREAERLRAQAEADRAKLRAELLARFRMILNTRDTDRGLVVNMSDLLFDSGKFVLRPAAKEKLARIAGIALNYPDLKIEVEGHTDNVGSSKFNQQLSEERAGAVKEYLLLQGLSKAAITAVGRGYDIPVAANDTAEGRQQNRRVELIVSGTIIGTAIGELK